MRRQLKVNSQKCIGCKSCELACSLRNYGVFNPSVSMVSIITFIEGDYQLPYNFVATCRQCEDAPCLASCPTEAISHREDDTKAVIIDREKCIGCGACVKACPFGAMRFDAVAKKPFKCELCGGDPACAQICPTGAIVFTESKPFYAQPEDSCFKAYLILSKRNEYSVKRKSEKAT